MPMLRCEPASAAVYKLRPWGDRLVMTLIKLAVAAAAVAILAAGAWLAPAYFSDDPVVRAVHHWDRSLQDRRADLRRKPKAVLRFAGITPGTTVVDLLGGDGYYAELIARVVGPEGRVYLQNNSLFLRFSAEELESRLAGNRLPNVVRLDSEFANLKLPAGADLIFMGLSYHDIYVPRDDPTIMTSPEEFFPQIDAALKPGGRILVIDHAAEPGSGTQRSAWEHRIAEDYAVADFERHGYRLLGRLDVLRNPDDDYTLRIWNDAVRGRTDRFVLLFEKPAAAD